MSQWVRLWDDMPTDPKWRVIGRRSGRSIAEVIAVFNFMLVNAGANATERNGTLTNFDDEDVAAALDIDACHVASIREAMQGKTLDGDRLTGWDRRQPKREDGAADRAKAWREKKKSDPRQSEPSNEREGERKRTQENADERSEKIQSREDTDTDKAAVAAFAPAAAPEKISKEEIERRCEQAAGFGEMSHIGKITALVDAGSDLEGRVLPIIREMSRKKRERGERPENWLYFVAAIADPDRRAPPPIAPPTEVAATVFVPHGSPAWQAWDDYGRRTKGSGYPSSVIVRGEPGWRFPTEYPPKDSEAAA